MGLTRSWQRPRTWNSAIDALACLELEGLEVSPRAVGGAAARLAKQGQWVRLLELLETFSSKNFQPDLRIAGCCLWSPWPRALHLLHSSGHLAWDLAASDAVLHSSAMKALGNRWRRVLRLLEEPGYQLNHIHLSLLMVSSSHDDSHDTWRLATSLLPWWRRRGSQADGPMVSSGVAACNQGRQWQLGIAIFENKTPGKSRATSEVIGALGPRQWPCSLALFASLSHWRMDVDVACLTRAAGSVERQLAWRISLDLLATEGQQFTWDLLTFNLALNVYGRSNWRSALALLFSTFGGGHGGPSPDAASYGCLVQTCCRAQEMEKAQELVKEAGRQGALSPVTWTLLASGARWSSATQLLSTARQQRLVDAMLHRAVMSSCEAPGRWREALQLLQQLAPADATAVAFGSTTAACGVPTWRVRWKEALSLLEVAETRLVPVASVQLAAALKATALRWRVVLALEDAYHCGDIISCELTVSSAVLGRSFAPIGRLLDETTDSSLALMNYLMGRCNFPSARSRRVLADGSADTNV
eukprot:s2236_g16.t1